MSSSLVDRECSQRIKKRVYMPAVDEYHSSSQPLTDVAMEDILGVAPSRSKMLKEGYLTDLTREAGISPCSLMLGLLYIRRLSQTNPKYLKTISSRDLFLVSMVIASKYMNDEGELEALANSEWARIGCKPKAALDELERNFLEAIVKVQCQVNRRNKEALSLPSPSSIPRLDWRLYVSLEEYYSFVTSVEGRIALNQACARGWLTYTDLDAIWEATDLQNTMLSASKQTAKVACGSAALYVMCIATLLSASHSVRMTSEILNPTSTALTGASSLLHPDTAGSLPHGEVPQPPVSLGCGNLSSWGSYNNPDSILVLGGCNTQTEVPWAELIPGSDVRNADISLLPQNRLIYNQHIHPIVYNRPIYDSPEMENPKNTDLIFGLVDWRNGGRCAYTVNICDGCLNKMKRRNGFETNCEQQFGRRKTTQLSLDLVSCPNCKRGVLNTPHATDKTNYTGHLRKNSKIEYGPLLEGHTDPVNASCDPGPSWTANLAGWKSVLSTSLLF